ncbi:SusC/RagA family TonB-linked outer membrane protein [Flavobacteriaceae bacterium F08102]|nr:SusC/RagA family TonB-linked outer membrane protein [Flavobacteriaceae bacterium F08102]
MKIKLSHPFLYFKKRQLMMITRTFIFLLCTTLFSFTPENTFSQAKVTIDHDQLVTVNRIFEIIKEQTDYKFMYSKKMFKNAPKVQLKKGTIRVDKLLNQSIKTDDIDVILSGDNIIHIKKRIKNQSHQVTGKVTDQDGNPIPGVNVIIKNKTIGTSTDFDGNYKITASSEDILIFSFLGYEKKEIKIGSQNKINVTLNEAANELEEITLNAGYYTTTRKLSTGSIGSVKGAVINRQPVVDPIAGLKGQIAGLQITQNDGTPGSTIRVRIRGLNSLNTGAGGTQDANLPLYIVDGVPVLSEGVNGVALDTQSPLAFLNTADIESVSVLKDADATAIYGSRGSNGVILITTKQAKSGKSNIKVEYSYGQLKFQNLNKVKYLETPEYLEMRKTALINTGQWPVDPNNYFRHPDLFLWDQTKNTNWRNELLSRIGEQSRGSFSSTGGTENTNYLFSANLSKETSIYNYDDSAHKSASGLLNVNHKAKNNGFHTNISIRYSITTNDQNPAISNGLTGIITDAFRLAPNAPDLFKSDGSINYDDFVTNPLQILEEENEVETRHFLSSFTIGYKNIIPGLNTKIDVGYTDQRVSEFHLTPVSSFSPSEINSNPARGRHDSYNVQANTTFVEPEINYTKRIGDHNVQVILGGTFQSSTTDGTRILGYGYTSDLLLRNLEAAEIKVVNTNFSEYKYTAIFGRLNYNYKNKYILNLTGRRDGSSRFGPNNKFGNFGAVGAAWVFSEENFVKDNLPFLSFGKLKGSYGITGSDNIPNYGYLDAYETGYGYNGGPSYSSVRAANPDYSWEENKKLELAAELGVFNDRVRMELAWYRNHSSNQLIGLPLASMTGFNSLQSNFPALVENKGLEFTLNANIINTNDIRWSAAFNISKERNILKEFDDIEDYSAYNDRYVVGKSLYGLKRYKSLGVDPATGLMDIVDLNEDGKISYLDKLDFIDLRPDFYGGFQNTFSYKNFDLNIGLTFKKVKGPNYDANFLAGMGNYSTSRGTNVTRSAYENSWKNPGDNTKYGQINFLNPYYAQTLYHTQSSSIIVDKSYVKLQNVSINYNVPKELIKVLGLSDLNVYVRGQNLATFTSYEGVDPETGDFSLPALRTFITGLQLTF